MMLPIVVLVVGSYLTRSGLSLIHIYGAILAELLFPVPLVVVARLVDGLRRGIYMDGDSGPLAHDAELDVLPDSRVVEPGLGHSAEH